MGKYYAKSYLPDDSDTYIASVYPSDPYNTDCSMYKLGISFFEYPNCYIPNEGVIIFITINTLSSSNYYNYLKSEYSDIITVECSLIASDINFNYIIENITYVKETYSRSPTIHVLLDSIYNKELLKWMYNNRIYEENIFVFYTLTTIDIKYMYVNNIYNVYVFTVYHEFENLQRNNSLSIYNEFSIGYYATLFISESYQLSSPKYEENIVIPTYFSTYFVSSSHYANIAVGIYYINNDLSPTTVAKYYSFARPYLNNTEVYCHPLSINIYF